MRLAVVAVGRLRRGVEADLCTRYLDRGAKAGRGLGFTEWRIHEIRESRAGDAGARQREEAAAIRAAAGGGRLVCLDEGGEDVTSERLAEWLRAAADAGTDVAFAIGGPDGLDPALVAEAELSIAFGRQTWPHQLVRIMLAEQLYRAMTILAGHPYHRA
jgi:23S rRNA (pseudouridine1915-N3)-methyltransferase